MRHFKALQNAGKETAEKMSLETTAVSE